MSQTIHKRIIDNLSGRVVAVNPTAALIGIRDWNEGMEALNTLVRQGVITKTSFSLPDNMGEAPAYKLTPTYRSVPNLVVDNTVG